MKILSGWKEIANHLNQGVRTVQRWEVIGLPIHRVKTGGTGPVIAFAEELDHWAEHAPVRYADMMTDCHAEIAGLKRELAKQRSELQKLKSVRRSKTQRSKQSATKK